ncbi:UDP-glucosyltransferase 29-like [Cryptomeria japonica]|uniref:UDP-glucosyltransferase 29-like n=1 Tax=Cryptomeria japonica TaxID=3369 RepID=UPI0027DA8DBC|nr:UDP-glucosyltransferase 29-like [Cryptomeria japonica]
MRCDRRLPGENPKLCLLRLQSGGICLPSGPLEACRDHQGPEGGGFDATPKWLSPTYHLVEAIRSAPRLEQLYCTRRPCVGVLSAVVWNSDKLVRQGEDTSDDYLVQWLDKQRPSSVVFLSFESELFLSAEQISELALALEDIALPFLWSLRSSDGTSSTLLLLLEGFEGRTRDRGLVVGGWVPQGVNCRQVALELNAGIEVDRNEEGCFSREEVCKAVWMVMGK